MWFAPPASPVLTDIFGGCEGEIVCCTVHCLKFIILVDLVTHCVDIYFNLKMSAVK